MADISWSLIWAGPNTGIGRGPDPDGLGDLGQVGVVQARDDVAFGEDAARAGRLVALGAVDGERLLPCERVTQPGLRVGRGGRAQRRHRRDGRTDWSCLGDHGQGVDVGDQLADLDGIEVGAVSGWAGSPGLLSGMRPVVR